MIVFNNPAGLAILNLVFVIFVTAFLVVYKYLYPKKNINILVLLFIISIIPTLSIFRFGTYRAGDLSAHYVLFMDFYQNLKEGIIIPQWAGRECGGFGCPLFIIEYILPFYIASIFHVVGFSFLTSIKLVLVSSFVASGFTMYLWAKDEFGKIGGFASALLYLYAPYHLIDFHFRAGLGEIVSFVFIPLLFYFAKKIIETRKRKFFFLESLSIMLILMSHSSTTITCLPLAIGYGVVVWFRRNKRAVRELVFLISSVIYGILLSVWYWGPAIYEVRYTTWSQVSFGDFKPVWEYLFSPVLFGLLFQGHQGEYRLIIGYFHIIGVFFAIVLLLRGTIQKSLKWVTLYLLVSFVFLFFMLQSISKPVWQAIPLLHTFIVVWRMLIPIAFITSAIGGIVLSTIKQKKIIYIICFVAIVYTVPNWGNRSLGPPLPRPFQQETDFFMVYTEKDNPLFEHPKKISAPLLSSLLSKPPSSPLSFIKGSGTFITLKKTETEHQFVVKAKTPVVIKDNTEYFPGWIVQANNKAVPIIYNDPNNLGQITFALKKGIYKIDVDFKDTPVVFVSRVISVIALLAGLSFIFVFRGRRYRRE